MVDQPPTAHLDMRVFTADIDGGDDGLELWTDDDFRREIEKKVTGFVADLLSLRRRDVEVESEWYFSAWPCPELVGPQHEDQCGEATTPRHDAYGRDRGHYRFCGDGHRSNA